MSKLKQVEMKPDEDEFETLTLTGDLLTAILTTAARRLPPEKATELRRGLDSGELNVQLICIWGASGMRIRADIVNQMGNGEAILSIFVPPSENESSNEAGTPSALH
jgi:hypothetical protein